MIQYEEVALPFPSTAAHFDAAIAAFAEQYHVEVDVTICGHVALSGGHYCLLPTWFHVQAVDRDLDVFGLGHTEDDEEELLWVCLAGPGVMRLAPAGDWKEKRQSRWEKMF